MMNSEVIRKYITKRYDRWLDYAKYHCSHHGMGSEATDVLNEVLIMLLDKCNTNRIQIMQLYESKKGKYRELDFFILQMIKLNITSETSPYRYKYKSIPTDENIDVNILDIIDDSEEEPDYAGDILRQMHIVRETLEGLLLSDKAKAIFSFKFFQGENLTDWPGDEDIKYLQYTYNQVLELIRNKIKGDTLF